MRAGTTLADPARIDIRGTLTCGRDVRIDVGCVFEGDVRLGDGVRIEPYCVLRDATLGADSVVAAYSHLDHVEAGERCRIGPYARLRPGTGLAEDVHIGNFVEVKASDVGAGAKINHLSYIGDASIGAKTNVGAGTITCNYDGFAKYRTEVGAHAFIGSNSALVAPVKIGDGAYVGSGSVITQDVAADALALARAGQVEKPGWARALRETNRK